MKIKKRKLTALIIATIMCTGMLSITALATETNEEIIDATDVTLGTISAQIK